MRKKILIVVKAYPSLSTKYKETVCTAGITEEGEWIRIYPIPYRQLDYEERFQKYEWIELDIVKNSSDFRPESYRPKDIKLKDMKSLGIINADGGVWAVRRPYVLKNVYTDLAQLISEAKNKDICTSIAVFKPTKIIDFIYKKVEGNWQKSKIKALERKNAQISLFESENESDIDNFEVVNKLPYKFSFVFEDINGRKSTQMIEDWETGMLYWNSYNRHNGDEKKACEDVRKKYYDDFAKTKDYYLILGTTKIHHYRAPNPFVIIGDFRPKKIVQESLFDM